MCLRSAKVYSNTNSLNQDSFKHCINKPRLAYSCNIPKMAIMDYPGLSLTIMDYPGLS